MAAAKLKQSGDDVEISRADAQFTFDHLPRLATRPIHIEQLRQTIINLAVRGRLVPQDPTDEPTAELLKRIQAEKMRRKKEGTFHEQSSLTPIQENETDFVLPKGWLWVRMAEIIKLWNGFAFKSTDFSQKASP